METSGVREEQHLWGVCQDRFSFFCLCLLSSSFSLVVKNSTACVILMLTEVRKPDEKHTFTPSVVFGKHW